MAGKIPFLDEILLGIKIVVPVFGIVFFDWSIGTIFLYFCLEFLFIAAETVLKMIFARRSTFLQKIGGMFRFGLIFTGMVFAIMVLVGQFFDAGKAGNMQAHFEKEMLYLLGGVYLLDFLATFVFTGRYKKASSEDTEKGTYKLLVILFISLAIFLALLAFVSSPAQSNYVLGIGIILARNAGEYLITRKQS